MSRRGAVPVVMYHRVGPEIDDWAWSNSLTISSATFEDHLRWLRKSRYYTATLEELHMHMSGGTALPKRSVVLTFDDGYIDNWSYVVPLLYRYGFKGSIAVVPEFVDPRDIVRPTLEDVWASRVSEAELELRAFMSWSELKTSQQRGVLSVVSHSMTHTWFASGPQVVDFHRPGGNYYWLDWNHSPDGKPFYLRRPADTKVPWGTPVYENGRALDTTRYFPDPSESDQLVDCVSSKGGRRFFDGPDWRDTLHEVVRTHRGSWGAVGRFESESERARRFESELRDSQNVIEKKLGTPVRHFLWPGQVFTDEAMRMARRVYDSLDWSHGHAALLRFNQPGGDAGIFRRVGVPDVQAPRRIHYPGGRYLVDCLEEFRGVAWARKRRQALKLLEILRLRLTG